MGSINAIAAAGLNNEIGYNNALVFKDSEDMSYFKAMTMYNTVVMGSKTFESMGQKPLRNRFNIVVTRNPEKYRGLETDKLVFTSENQITQPVFSSRLKLEDIWIIGGGEIYKLFLGDIERFYISRFARSEKADTFLPNLKPYFRKKYLNRFANFSVEEWYKKQ